MRVCFVGAGLIGAPMVVSLLRAGHDVVVFDPWSRHVGRLESLGARFAPTLTEAARHAEVVAVCVVSGTQALDIVSGPGNALTVLPSGSTLIMHSSIDPDTCRELATTCTAVGVDYLDAMVSGYPYKAEAGDLTLMIGGDDWVYERCRPYFDALGGRQFLLGGPGAGAAAKLINNVMANASILASYDALNLARLNGIDLDTMIDVAMVCSGASDALVQWRNQGWHHGPENKPQELLGLNAIRGMQLALDDARSRDWDLPIVDALISRVAELEARGHP